MTIKGSYQVQSFASNTDAEIRRLNAQVDLFWPVESEVLLRNGLRDGMRVVDCGCGPGRLTELLKRRLPALQCVGIEIDPCLVEAGRKHLAGVDDCLIQQGSAEEPGLPAGSFDFAIMRLVLEHVPDPLAALRSVGALLKPGGRLAVISNDFDYHLRTFPPVPELEQLYEAYRASRRKDGGDPCIGRRVPRLLVDAGFTLAACEIELAHNALLGDAPFLKAEGAGIPAQLVRSGFLDGQVLEQMTRTWRAMLTTPDHSIARPLWVAVGERSNEAGARGGERQAAAVPEAGATNGAAQAAALARLDPIEQLATLIAQVTGRPEVTPDDSLAALSIDSIAAMMLQERIKDLTGVEIPVVKFFADEPVRKVAELLTGARPEARAAAPAPTPKPTAGWVEGEI